MIHKILWGTLQHEIDQMTISDSNNWSQMITTGPKCYHLELMLSCETNCHHVEADFVIWFLLRCKVPQMLCYHLVLSCYLENFTNSYNRTLAVGNEAQMSEIVLKIICW